MVKGIGPSNVVDILYTSRSDLDLSIPHLPVIGMALGGAHKEALMIGALGWFCFEGDPYMINI